MSESEERARRWKSLTEGYLAPSTLTVDPSVQFLEDEDVDLDPITYEVIRSKFWDLNWDHQEAIRRTSGSVVVTMAFDFNTSLQTERGDGVVFGPGNTFFAGSADLVVQWTLEHRSGNVGINDGDVFIQDDPWVGTNHAMDTCIYRPVFVGGKLFAWVYNVVHQRELGGVEPGGFVQSASDVYSESTFWPPVKIVQDGKLREDLVDAWVRRSRLPGLMTLELKSQLAGVHVAHERLQETVDKYGPGTIKATMRRMIKDTARVVGDRLRTIPDGQWRDTRYIAGAQVGDKKLYRHGLTMTKKGDRLLIGNEGTDEPSGSFNIARGVFRACVVNALLPLLAWDQYLCGAGLLEQVDFDLPESRISSAHHPSAVSTSLGMTSTINLAHYVTAKMLSAAEPTSKHIFAASGLNTLIVNHMVGINQRGEPFLDLAMDGVTGALGAFSFRDGLDHGGAITSTTNPVPSVEIYERLNPVLYLYRREVPFSGGHGQWRGGATFASAWTGHKSDEVLVSSGGIFQSVTQGIGLLGALPGSGGTMWHALEAIDSGGGGLPRTPEEARALAPDAGSPPPKKFDNRLSPGDIFEAMPPPGAGFGDPILRDPELVALDLAAGRVSNEDVVRLYGVVVDDAGAVESEATRAARERELGRRLQAARPPRRPVEGQLEGEVRKALWTVVVGRRDEQLSLACAYCRRLLADEPTRYRWGCAELEMSLPSISARLFIDPFEQTDKELVFRHYLCPGCGTAIDGEICQPADEPTDDVRIDG
jgi:N-methylhydantoinase B